LDLTILRESVNASLSIIPIVGHSSSQHVAEQDEVEENAKEKELKSNHRVKYRKGDPKSEKFLPPAKVADDCNKADNLISRINKFKGLQKMKIVKIRKNTEVSKTLHLKKRPSTFSDRQKIHFSRETSKFINNRRICF